MGKENKTQETTPKVELTKQEMAILVNVIEQVSPRKLSDARVLISISDKLRIMQAAK